MYVCMHVFMRSKSVCMNRGRSVCATHVYMYACLRAHIHDVPPCQTSICTDIHTYIHMPTYMYSYIHAYMRTYIHMHIQHRSTI